MVSSVISFISQGPFRRWGLDPALATRERGAAAGHRQREMLYAAGVLATVVLLLMTMV